MLEKMKAAFSKMSVLAAAYLPSGFKETMLQMAGEIDRLRSEIDELKGK
jgi:uncharacterized coiled-coil DUF342 family protein